jgi:hypothetical protein
MAKSTDNSEEDKLKILTDLQTAEFSIREQNRLINANPEMYSHLEKIEVWYDSINQIARYKLINPQTGTVNRVIGEVDGRYADIVTDNMDNYTKVLDTNESTDNTSEIVAPEFSFYEKKPLFFTDQNGESLINDNT